MTSVVMSKTTVDAMQWRRRLETFGSDDAAIVAAGPGNEVDAVWYVLSDIPNLDLHLTL